MRSCEACGERSAVRFRLDRCARPRGPNGRGYAGKAHNSRRRDDCHAGLRKRARTVRDWIVTPLAPLADWIATHWWSLLQECVTPSRSTVEFEQRHLLRTAEEGFVLPNLRLVPEGDSVLAICEPRATRHATVDYVARERTASEACVRDVLASFVDAAVTRADQSNIPNTPLHSLWRAVQDTSAEEADFCRLAGRLGLDPYDLDETTSGKLLAMAQQLGPSLLEDRAGPCLQPTSTTALPGCWAGSMRFEHARHRHWSSRFRHHLRAAGIGPPWSLGYALADEFRKGYGLGGTDPFNPSLVFQDASPFLRRRKTRADYMPWYIGGTTRNP